MNNATLCSMDGRTAEFLDSYIFVGYRFHDLGAGKKHIAVVFDHD